MGRVGEHRSTSTNQATGVIGMGVSQDHEVDLLRCDAGHSKIFDQPMPLALETPWKITITRVHEHALARDAYKKRLTGRPNQAHLIGKTAERLVPFDLRHAREQELPRKSHPPIAHQAADRRAHRERHTHSRPSSVRSSCTEQVSGEQRVEGDPDPVFGGGIRLKSASFLLVAAEHVRCRAARNRYGKSDALG